MKNYWKTIIEVLKKVKNSKLVLFLTLALWVVGVIGGTCALFYYHEFVPALGTIVSAILSWPKVKAVFYQLTL